MKAVDVIKLYGLLQKHGITVRVDGGWGVDALLGYQSRQHADLDIVIQKKDVLKLRKLLHVDGYIEKPIERSKPHNFVLKDTNSREIDAHVIDIDEKGNGVYGPIENGVMYPSDSLTGIGKILDTEVRCISAEWLVKFHTGYEPKEKDIKDITALCEKFKLPLPSGFEKKQY